VVEVLQRQKIGAPPKKTDVPIDEGNVARPGVVVDLVALVVEGEASSFESVIFRTVRPPILGKSHDD
jgi:hypothetical protein